MADERGDQSSFFDLESRLERLEVGLAQLASQVAGLQVEVNWIRNWGRKKKAKKTKKRKKVVTG